MITTMLSPSATEATTTDTKECCPPFNLPEWENVTHIWNKKLFLKDTVPEFLHIPFPGTYSRAITRMWKTASDAGAAPEIKDFLLLAHDPSAFKAELYMSVTKEVPGHNVVKFTGTFFSRVYEGSYSDVPKCLRETDKFLAANAMIPKKYYIYFPYCPNCAKKYGHHYLVVVAEINK